MARFNTTMYDCVWFSRKSRIIVIRIFTEKQRKSHISTQSMYRESKSYTGSMTRRAIDPLKRLKTLKTKIKNP